MAIGTSVVPLPDASADLILLIFAAHEIRDAAERTRFFGELRRTLTPDGQLMLVEHLRNPATFGAYTLGFLHFLSRKTWLATFAEARLRVWKTAHITPFVTVFLLEKE